MQDSLLHFFEKYPQLAIIISICLSVLIAILGVVPSIFITAANILFFGFWNGTLLSFLGEAAGAAIAFLLYRKGFKKSAEEKITRYPKLELLVNSTGSKAFYLVFSLRLIPFVPSGLVTFAAAIGKISFVTFLLASSLGKLPALLMEAYAVREVSSFGWQGKLILITAAISLLYWIIVKKKK
ncbi:MAG: TVP38/TMEM64 family protein [Gloeobacteraceae cyanobacterium ES-bin-316]|nr:TVP38/TMEM64 family protein [Ferruginibacter sp.]